MSNAPVIRRYQPAPVSNTQMSDQLRALPIKVLPFNGDAPEKVSRVTSSMLREFEQLWLQKTV